MSRYALFAEFAEQYAAEHPDHRRGQAWFNALAEFDMSVADELWGNAPDPFHHDDRLPEFQAWVRHRMDEEEA